MRLSVKHPPQGLFVQVPEAVVGGLLGEGVNPGGMLLVGKDRLVRRPHAMAHGFDQRVAGMLHTLVHHCQRVRKLARGRPEPPLADAERLDGAPEGVQLQRAAVGPEVHVEVELVDDGEGGVGCAQDLAVGLVGGNGLMTLLEEHHLVELALDFCMHDRAVRAVEPIDACVADGILVGEDQRMHGAVQQVVAEETGCIGVTHRALGMGQHGERIVEGRQQLRRAGFVHEATHAALL